MNAPLSHSLLATRSASKSQYTGTEGDDTLEGSLGADTLVGLGGDDSYVVNHSGDKVKEAADAGLDTVLASISWHIGNHIENLTLTGSADLDGIGNRLDNLIIGNSGDNKLNGHAGADTLVGGDGNDLYVVDDAGDVVTEADGQGNDRVRAHISYTLGDFVEQLDLRGDTDIDGTGNALDNLILGNFGNNHLDGGLGADTLRGGAGDDRYTVDNAGDMVFEKAGAGTDTVYASISYSLGGDLENLVLTGPWGLNGTGNGLNNQITGTESNNWLDGGAGVDTLSGGIGGDTYLVEDSADVVEETGSDWDQVLSTANSYTLADGVEGLQLIGDADLDGYGNTASNWMVGSLGANHMDGAEGDDTLFGNLGDDTLLGGEGADELHGEAGSDWLEGGAGDDRLYDEGDEADTLSGGEGSDRLQADWSSATAAIVWDNSDPTASVVVKGNTISGFEALSLTLGSGDDVITTYAGAAENYIDAGAGNDWVSQQSVNPDGWSVGWVHGGAGNDTLIGSSGNDGGDYWNSWGLFGGEGDDVIDAGAGNDVVNDEAGNDTLIGGANTDWLLAQWSDATRAIVWDNSDPSVSAEVNGNTISGFESLNLTLGSGDDVITTYAGAADNYLDTGAGNDWVMSQSVNPDGWTVGWVHAGAGNDTLIGSSGNDGGDYWNSWGLFGGEGDDVIDTGAGNDVINDEAGNDTLTAGSGNDTVIDGLGDDVIDGGEGSDRLQADWSSATAAIVWDNSDPSASVVQHGNTVSGFESLSLTLGSGDDVVTTYAGAADNHLDTGAGNDWVTNQSVNADGWSVGWVRAGAGNDTLIGSSGNDGGDFWNTWGLFGGEGDDVIDTGAGNDVINDEAGNDTLTAGSGNDTVIDGLGDDVIDGGEGSDRLQADWSDLSTAIVWDNSDPSASVVQHGNTVSGFESLSLTLGSGDEVITTYAGPAENYIDTGAGNDWVMSQSVNADGWSVGWVHAGAGNDTLIGSSGNDGGDFWNSWGLFGGEGDDVIDTGAGNDVINDEAGNDTLIGGAGSDVVYLAVGSDTVVLNSLLGDDNVFGWASGEDILRIDQTEIMVGNGDTVVDGAITVSAAGEFDAEAELVVFTTATEEDIHNTTIVASLLDHGASAWASGDTALFMVHDTAGTEALYLFTSADGDAMVSAAELTLLATLHNSSDLGLGDVVFGG